MKIKLKTVFLLAMPTLVPFVALSCIKNKDKELKKDLENKEIQNKSDSLEKENKENKETLTFEKFRDEKLKPVFIKLNKLVHIFNEHPDGIFIQNKKDGQIEFTFIYKQNQDLPLELFNKVKEVLRELKEAEENENFGIYKELKKAIFEDNTAERVQLYHTNTIDEVSSGSREIERYYRELSLDEYTLVEQILNNEKTSLTRNDLANIYIWYIKANKKLRENNSYWLFENLA
ncbi:hypothetical protein [Mycoplasma struthionis]|uniref:Lipoprotein n=1 Tax=Mycoplasma struthionis TaxID=538220 RepID=A0A502M922_9MOLU|nr:hypothetical protein [Mycoplasma struthionis]TPI01960.1 hypothetical protein FJM01_01770 [Mycoplasma struthionis]